MPQRKKKARFADTSAKLSRVKRTKTRSTVPAWAKNIPPAQLEQLRREYIMAGGSQTGMGVWDWIKGAAKKVGKFVKDNGIVSKGLTTIGAFTGQPELIAAGAAAGSIGFGRRRQRGGAIVGIVQTPQKPMLMRR